MSFAHPLVLLALLLPVAWGALLWRQAAGRRRLLVKVLALCAVVVALAQPRMQTTESRVATAILVDTSASMTRQDLERASDLASRMVGARGRNWARVIPFAGTVQDTGSANPLPLRTASGEASRSTDLETAIREGTAAMPSGMVPRLVLISDGNETSGSAARAAWQAQHVGVPVDTFAVPGRPKPLLRLESVHLPTTVYTGERFPIDLVLQAPRDVSARVTLMAEGKQLGVNSVALRQGETPLRVYASVATPGALELSGTVSAEGYGEVHFQQALHLHKPRMLFLTNDPAGTESHLLSTARAAQFDVTLSNDAVGARLAGYQLVVLNNWDMDGLPAVRKAELERFAQQGGGLLVIGGERNVYKEGKKSEDDLERALPATVAPPRTPESTVIILIVDKSSSMEGRKMELARLAAIGVIENLRPTDQVGVLIFDNSFQWAVPVRRAEDRSTIKRLVAGITPDGGTQIAPALSEAYRRVRDMGATYKHVVLLTDGISEEGDSIALSKDAAQQRVTISTVGLGQDVNRSYLEKVASFSKGKSYFLIDPSGLEQILIKDVKEFTGSTAVEKPIVPRVEREDSVLEGIDFSSVPPLRGYVKFTRKPTADTILTLDEKDPLLARWQYGLGRTAVFASDAKARWAEQWVSWKGFDPFWANLFRDLLPHAQGGEAVSNYDSASGQMVVRYRLGPNMPAPTRPPDLYAFGPNGFQRALPIQKVAAGVYEGRLPIGDRQGLFRVRPVTESAAFPEVGLYRPEEELLQYGSNERLLRQVSAFTGGRFQPDVRDVFQADGRSIPRTMELWPLALSLALGLSLLELLLRKWSGVFGTRSPV